MPSAFAYGLQSSRAGYAGQDAGQDGVTSDLERSISFIDSHRLKAGLKGNPMLLDKYLPKYTFREYHEIYVSSSKEAAYAAAKNLDFSKSKIIRFLFAVRGLPTNDMTLEGFSKQVNFTL